MRAVLARVSEASVFCGDYEACIGKGFLVLLGIEADDTARDAGKLASKIAGLRIFEDAEGKMNRSLSDENGEMMVISNFTLAGDVSHGRRPSFDTAMRSGDAEKLYRAFLGSLAENGVTGVREGVFGGDMKVSSVNDGPCTFIIDSKTLK